MGAKSAVISPGKISDKTVRQQLTRILVSKTFSQVDRLKRFVDFIVSETVEGRGGDLKEYVIGVQVFGKEASFDPRTDPIVRVQARRLRARLAEPALQDAFSGILPRDSSNLRHTRFAVNFFTSIGLGALTDDLRDFLKKQQAAAASAVTAALL